MINTNEVIGTHHILFVTLDTLRYDVAVQATIENKIPQIQSVLPNGQWEQRHSPGSFTYAAHHAFFAGFLPTPIQPGIHPRLFATQFPGSVSISPNTKVFSSPDIITGFAESGYRTICIGGVSFFNKMSPLGDVLPALFQESYWDETLGITNPQSTLNQVNRALELIRTSLPRQKIFLYINISAIHQPNYFYLPGETKDSTRTQLAALAQVDIHLPSVFYALQQRGPVLVLLLSDHGTCYGEDGYYGHRLAHPVVWTVPYAEFLLPAL